MMEPATWLIGYIIGAIGTAIWMGYYGEDQDFRWMVFVWPFIVVGILLVGLAAIFNGPFWLGRKLRTMREAKGIE